MKDVVSVRVLFSDGEFEDATIEYRYDASAQECSMTCSSPSFGQLEVVAEDIFNALIELRVAYEKCGVQLLCAGARPDVWPSGMSRSMGGGRKAYVCRMGESATRLLDIFEYARPDSVGTVAEQARFREAWTSGFE